ncbi:MAG TPA: hypothetical protein VN622_17985 [Clostridia bacterium]|nr:hypothetical protein [Clostridia bacterium]
MLSISHQLFQLCGALLLLAAYMAHQFKWIDARKSLYNILNGVGSAILGFYAVWPQFQAGFVVLEVVWTAISIHALWRAMRKEKHAA